ncbi:MAG: hypothetical protein JNL74_15885 [Fibrobacteres bacterium]|nr:hypothetical protein [Fibrobacterota bacterium]
MTTKQKTTIRNLQDPRISPFTMTTPQAALEARMGKNLRKKLIHIVKRALKSVNCPLKELHLVGSRASFYWDAEESDIDLRIGVGKRGMLILEKPVANAKTKSILTERNTDIVFKRIHLASQSALLFNGHDVECDFSDRVDPDIEKIAILLKGENLIELPSPVYDVLENKWLHPPYEIWHNGRLVKKITKCKDALNKKCIRRYSSMLFHVCWNMDETREDRNNAKFNAALKKNESIFCPYLNAQIFICSAIVK